MYTCKTLIILYAGNSLTQWEKIKGGRWNWEKKELFVGTLFTEGT